MRSGFDKDVENLKKYSAFIGSTLGAMLETGFFFSFDSAARRLQKHRGQVISWQPEQSVMHNVQTNYGSIDRALFKDRTQLSAGRKLVDLHNGFAPGLMYKMIQRTYKFTTQKELKNWLIKNKQFSALVGGDLDKIKLWASGLAGCMVGAGEVIFLPVDIIKIKYQTNKASYQNKNFFDIWRTENPFKGIGAAIPRNMVGSTAMFGVSEFLKLRGHNPDMANAAAVAMSILLPSPFDVIKTRVQAEKESARYMDVVKKTYRTEGLGAFYKGAFAKVLTQGPKGVFCFAVVDRVEKWFESDAPVQFAQTCQHRFFQSPKRESPKEAKPVFTVSVTRPPYL